MSGLLSWHLLMGSCVVVAASVTYLACRQDDDDDYPSVKLVCSSTQPSSSVSKCGLQGHGVTFVMQMAGATFIVVLALFLAFASTTDPNEPNPRPAKFTDIVSDSLITCRRQPLLSTSWYPHERTYHDFDDVLLIIFFSHARYDVNLDSYREVYPEFFPNVRPAYLLSHQPLTDIC